MKKLIPILLPLLGSASLCSAQLQSVVFESIGPCSITWGYTLYSGVNNDPWDCGQAGQAFWNCCNGPEASGNYTYSFDFTHSICPIAGVSVTIVGGPTSPTATATKYGVRPTIVYNCNGFFIYPMPGVKDNNDSPSNVGAGHDNRGDGCGMPVWRVSEPYLSLWLRDEPLGYQPALGPRVSFALEFGQQEASAGFDPTIFSAGKKWNNSLLGYVTLDANTNPVVNLPGGGSHTYSAGADYLTDSRLNGDTTNGFTVSYPDGRSDNYKFVVTNSSGGFIKAFLTDRVNPFGQKLHLNYATYSPSAPVIRLQSIVDGDGLTTSVSYVSSNPYSTNLIAQLTDPFSRTTTLLYDNGGHLTNITDVAGISSSFIYDNNEWITNLTTPYGPTSFKISDTAGNTVIPNGRAVEITEPDGGKELYLFTNNAPGIPASYVSGQVPNLSPYTGTTLDNSSMNTNNSFHWNKNQYAHLSSGFLGSHNISQLTTNDFLRARMRHWLRAGTNSVSETLSMEREPTPDGLVEGQKTWYDYAGKTNTEYMGTQILPLFVGQVLPDGTTRFTRTDRNILGLITTNVATYGIGASASTRTTTFAYATNGIDLLTVTNPLNAQVSSNAYNAYHQVVTNFDALGEMTTFGYNSNQQPTWLSRPAGLITTNTYFTSGIASNRLASSIDYAVIGGATNYYRTNSYTWSNGLVATHTDPLGLTVGNTWDNLQRLRRIDFPDNTFVTNTYVNLDLVQVIDRMGFSNSFGYDSVRHLVASTNATGAVTHYGYCSCGSLSAVTNAFGTALQAVTTYSWDLQGHMVQSVGPDLYTVTHYYNALGQETNTTDGLSSTTNWFNNQGLLIASSNAFGQVSAAIYDILDRVTNSVDANGVTVTNKFDNLSRLLTRGFPDGGVESFAYTFNVAAATSYTNQLGTNVVNYTFDPPGRKITEVYPGIATNTFAYDGVGNLLTLTDGKSQVTTWHYDQYGRATNKVDATSTEILRYTYDPDNRLTNRWSAAKGNTAYSFDQVGNLLTINYPHSGSISYSFDLLSRLTNMVDGVGTTLYGYTSVGLLSSEDGPWADDTVSYAYNFQRLRTGLNLLAPNASPWPQSYGYDAAERLTNLTSPAGTFGYAYDATRHAQVASLALPNTAYITNTFDAVARLLSTALKNSVGTALNSHQYGYNVAGQRTWLTNTSGDYRSFAYDNAGQLTAALGSDPGGTNRWHEQLRYRYDPAGNLNLRTNNDLVQTFNQNSLNELTSVSRTASMTVAGTTTSAATNVTVNAAAAVLYADYTFARTNVGLSDGTNTFTAIANDALGRSDTNSATCFLPATNSFTYDLNGNLTSDTTRNFAYDDENQLTSVWVTNVWRSDFVYDGKLRRRIRREYTWSFGAWLQTNEVRYIYDGNLVIQERDANNLPLVSYTRGWDLSGTQQGAGGIGGLLSRTDHTLSTFNSPLSTAFYHADGNGNITCLIDANQAVVAKYLYDPFGNILSKSGPLAEVNVYQFSSKEWHQSSGLSYYLRRYYDPNLQRWLNQDPAGELGGANLYAFAANSPINAVDSDGRFLFMGDIYNWVAGQLDSVAARSGNSYLGAAAEFTASLYRSSGSYVDPLEKVAAALGLWDNTEAIYGASRRECHGAAASTYNAAAYLAGNVFGPTPILEGYYKVDLATGAELSTAESWIRGVSGGLNLLAWGAGGLSYAGFGRAAAGGGTVGDILAGHSPDTMIHLTTATEQELATATFPHFTPPHTTPGVFQGSSWVKLGDVSHMTLAEYQEFVVGPSAAGYGNGVTAFLTHPPTSVFSPVNVPNLGGVQEFINGSVVKPGGYVPLPGR